MSLADDLTVCICTRDRPEDLELAIASVVENAPGATVVVSDDGEQPTRHVAGKFPNCIWQAGPRRGLGPNRNAAVRRVETDWVLFLDDDARLGNGFVAAIEESLTSAGQGLRQTVYTGCELNNGVLVEPSDVDFLGFQRIPYRPGDPFHTVVINAAVWPRGLFDRVTFDERLRYGSDEVDLSYSALSAGYRIEFCAAAVNEHLPSPSGREGYALDAQAARLRATTKRHWSLQRRRARAVAFLCVAPPHLLAALMKREGVGGLASFVRVLRRWLG